MPLYEYTCRECGHSFEVLQRIGEDGEALSCPQCQAPRPEKQLSTFASQSSGKPSAAGMSSGAGSCGGGGGFT